jgi:uncharacterized protein
MKLLVVSDVIVDWIYSPRIRLLQSDTDLVISCGDLPHYYLEYIISSLDKPLFQVCGNHSIPPAQLKEENFPNTGTIDLHCRVTQYGGKTFAGIEGSLRYNDGVYQYTQLGMWVNVIRILPAILMNRSKYGRYLDVMITHAPPWGIHDQQDLAHQGIKAFRWFISAFQPSYLIHGHVHVYRPDTITETRIGYTTVVNGFGYRNLELPEK